MKEFDTLIIGAGSAGYVAGIKSAQLGFKTAIIEQQYIGGTCLNVGCIPSKALLHSSHLYEMTQHQLASNGIEVDNPRINIQTMQKRKNNVIEKITSGVSYLLAKNKITTFIGEAKLDSQNKEVIVQTKSQQEILKGKHIIIATGSIPMSIPNVHVDEIDILSSTGALNLQKVPSHLVVVGGGVIGLEMGTIWARLGAKISIVEASNNILTGFDDDVINLTTSSLKKEGFAIHVNTKLQQVIRTDNHLQVTTDKQTLECDKILMAIGRKANLNGIDPNIQLNESNFIKIDENFETNIKGIYAIGDVTGGKMLAHKAEEEAISCIERIGGYKTTIHYNNIPSVIYLHPEIATVGLNETQAKSSGYNIQISKFPVKANGRSIAQGEMDGFCKLITNKSNDKLLGATIIASNAGELISEICLALEFHSSSEDIARTSHPHPGVSEIIKEAALGNFSEYIHI